MRKRFWNWGRDMAGWHDISRGIHLRMWLGWKECPGAALISWVLDKLYRVNSRTVWGNIYQYLENMHGRVDIAVAYMGPNVTPRLATYSNKFGVLISVDFEIPDMSPVRVIDVGNGYTRYAGKQYPHRLYVYEFKK